jgi:hypothetical protein
VDLRSDQINFTTATLHVRRVKQGAPATHPILGDELGALRRPQREQEPKSAFVFTRPNVARPSARRALLAWWSALVFPLSEPSPRNNAQRLALRTGARYRQRKARHNRPG